MKSLVKRKAWGGFWGCLYREVTISTRNANFDAIQRFPHIFMKMFGNREIPHILALWGGRGTQKQPQNLTFNKGIHPGGAKGQPVHQKSGHFSEIYLNIAKFSTFW